MFRCLPVAPLALALGLLAAHQAQAQDRGAWCADYAHRSCGDPGRQVSLADCMAEPDMWPSIPQECVGEIQTMIEMEREAVGQSGYGAIDQATSNTLGYSYGGILREGPGMEYRKAASLREGDQLEIIEATGTWFDGYQWFLVNTRHGTGYHWGGIFCTEGGIPSEGVLSSCN